MYGKPGPPKMARMEKEDEKKPLFDWDESKDVAGMDEFDNA